MSDSTGEDGFVDFVIFLQQESLGRGQRIRDYRKLRDSKGPLITLRCISEECEGKRVFECESDMNTGNAEGGAMRVLHYICRNCKKTRKTFALLLGPYETITKIGEWPEPGKPVDKKLRSVLGPEFDFYCKGRLAELQRLGIAAYAYFRRVVENRKDKLFNEVIKTANQLNADPANIQRLEAAKNETQFTKAIDGI